MQIFLQQLKKCTYKFILIRIEFDLCDLSMPLGRLLSDYERGQISGLATSGMSNRAIAKVIGRSASVVDNYIKDPENYGQNHAGGRPKSMTDRTERTFLRDLSINGRSINETRLSNGINASKTTCWRTASRCPTLKYQKMCRSPNLKPIHIQNRLVFAQNHMSWTDSWREVIFTDEKKFNLDGPDGFKFYWHDLRKEKQWFSKRVSGGGSLMVWAGVGYNGRTELVIIETKNNAKKYVEVLAKYLLPFTHRIIGDKWVLQQDNSSIHTSNLVKDWVNCHNVTLLDWPSLSPELNIIENVWSHLVRMVYSNGRQYNSTNELKIALFESWEQISQNYIQTLVDSMPNRVFDLILKGGHKINY